MSTTLKNQSFIPIILGGNLGSYSTARSFYEAYQVTSLVLCTLVTGPINYSMFIQPVVEPKMMQPEMLFKRLKELDDQYPNSKKNCFGQHRQFS